MSESTIKGAIAEAAITAEAVELGFVVSRPVIEGRRYDLIVDSCQQLKRCFYVPISAVAGQRDASAVRAHRQQPEDRDKLRGRSPPRGYSSAGRAFGWQPKGRGFESP